MFLAQWCFRHLDVHTLLLAIVLWLEAGAQSLAARPGSLSACVQAKSSSMLALHLDGLKSVEQGVTAETACWSITRQALRKSGLKKTRRKWIADSRRRHGSHMHELKKALRVAKL